MYGIQGRLKFSMSVIKINFSFIIFGGEAKMYGVCTGGVIFPGGFSLRDSTPWMQAVVHYITSNSIRSIVDQAPRATAAE